MKNTDTQEFFEIWDQCADLYGKTLKQESKILTFKLLAGYSLQSVRQALEAHMSDPETGRFMPRPADVIGKIQAISSTGYPGAEQAWAQFPRLETQTACICDEMAKAWGIACELDRITGRMAFKEAYEREVIASKAKGQQPKWFMTTGTDKQQRLQVTLDAVRNLQISPAAARVHLPHIPVADLVRLADQKISSNDLQLEHAQTVANMDQLLLSTPVSDSKTARLRLAEIKELLA
jgi:hypothetical protein